VTWPDLFERAAAAGATGEGIGDALTERREKRPQGEEGSGAATYEGTDPGGDPMARVVADADVLAADLLVGGPSRTAIDRILAHDWIRLVASDPLLADAEAVIADLAGADLAAAWRHRIEAVVVRVDHPPGDHPALASALRGDARHVLSLDEGLQSAGAGTALRREAGLEASVRSPDAFVRLFDPTEIHDAIHGETYPGPDRDPRA